EIHVVLQTEIDEFEVLLGDGFHEKLPVRDVQSFEGKQASSDQNLALDQRGPDILDPQLDEAVVQIDERALLDALGELGIIHRNTFVKNPHDLPGGQIDHVALAQMDGGVAQLADADLGPRQVDQDG